MSCAPSVIQISPDVVHLGRLLIFLVKLFSVKKTTNSTECVPIRIGDDNRYTQFKTAEKVLNNKMMAKEQELSTLQRKQTVLDLTSHAKSLLTGEIEHVESKSKNPRCQSYYCYLLFYKNALPFNIADSPNLQAVDDQCIEFGQQYHGRKYKAPNRRKISELLLESAYEDTHTDYGYSKKLWRNTGIRWAERCAETTCS